MSNNNIHNESYTSRVNDITTNTTIRVDNLVNSIQYCNGSLIQKIQETLIQEWYDYIIQIENAVNSIESSILSCCNISAILGDITGTHKMFDYYLHEYQPFVASYNSWVQDMTIRYPRTLGSLAWLIKTEAQHDNDADSQTMLIINSQMLIATEAYDYNCNGHTAEDILLMHNHLVP